MKRFTHALFFLFSFFSLCFLWIPDVFAADTTRTETRISISDGSSTILDTGVITKTFTTGVRQMQTVSLAASAFTAVSVPSGAKGIFVDVVSVRDLSIKGVTTDVGVSLDSTVPILLPFSADNVTIGFTNDNPTAQTIRVYWL